MQLTFDIDIIINISAMITLWLNVKVWWDGHYIKCNILGEYENCYKFLVVKMIESTFET